MRVVAGLSLKNLQPRVWDTASPYHLPTLRAVMVSYAEFSQNSARRRHAIGVGLHASLGIPGSTRIYLDNGSFYFSARHTQTDAASYTQFVASAKPNWQPIARDFIPSPSMTREEQLHCLAQTMKVNLQFEEDGYVPVIHISQVLDQYIEAVQADEGLSAKPEIALGGVVPNLLRAQKAMAYVQILDSLRRAREVFAEKRLHVFGIGGTATLHLAALFGLDSVDSSGWRNRAARGIVQLPGCGDRTVAELGSWRGRAPSAAEWERLEACPCPACRREGLTGLKANRQAGFCSRACHNLWVLLEEARWIDEQIGAGTYVQEFARRLDNSIYLPLIEQVAALRPPRSPKQDQEMPDRCLDREHRPERTP